MNKFQKLYKEIFEKTSPRNEDSWMDEVDTIEKIKKEIEDAKKRKEEFLKRGDSMGELWADSVQSMIDKWNKKLDKLNESAINEEIDLDNVKYTLEDASKMIKSAAMEVKYEPDAAVALILQQIVRLQNAAEDIRMYGYDQNYDENQAQQNVWRDVENEER